MNATTETREASLDATPRRPLKQAADRERLTVAQRAGEVVGIAISVIVMTLVASFFVVHQVTGTGFFTAAFGWWEMVFFYGPMVVSLAAPLARAGTGRRNPGRLAEAITNLFQAIATIWLLRVFPFNFAHLADAAPGALRFALAWVTNDIARVIMVVVIVICLLVAIGRLAQFALHALRASSYASGV